MFPMFSKENNFSLLYNVKNYEVEIYQQTINN